MRIGTTNPLIGANAQKEPLDEEPDGMQPPSLIVTNFLSLNVIQSVLYHVYFNLCSALSRQNIVISYNLRLLRLGQLMYFPTPNTMSPTNGTQ
jgi:hypothetical protein